MNENQFKKTNCPPSHDPIKTAPRVASRQLRNIAVAHLAFSSRERDDQCLFTIWESVYVSYLLAAYQMFQRSQIAFAWNFFLGGCWS